MPAGNENILSPLKVKEKSLNMLVFVFLNSLIKTLKAFQKYFETPKRIAKKKKKKDIASFLKLKMQMQINGSIIIFLNNELFF